MKYIELYNEKLLDFGEIVNKLGNLFSKEDIDDIHSKLIEELEKYKTKSKKNSFKKEEVKNIIKDLKKEYGKEIIEYLNLDVFLNGLATISIVKKNREKRIDSYFDEYVQDLPERLNDLKKTKKEKDKDRFYDDEEFQELMKLKSQVKPKISKKEFIKEKTPLQIELLKMIEWLKATGNKIALVFEGRDAAGKGSAIKTITEFLPPKQVNIAAFDIPTEEEKKNWFKRYIDRLPKPGCITFYDRSWYNRAVNDPVMGYCTFQEYEQFMEDVIPFEKKLIDDGYFLMKFWFSINRDIQELRFKMRQAHPLKYWKFSENDLKTMSKWRKFTEYKERMFLETGKNYAPWVIVDSNDKRVAQLNVMRYILNNIPYDNKDEQVVNNIYPEVIIEIKE